MCLMLKESYGNAFAPFLTSHYSKIIVVDPREFNRDGKPSLDLTQFAKEQGVDDLLVINYPYTRYTPAPSLWTAWAWAMWEISYSGTDSIWPRTVSLS